MEWKFKIESLEGWRSALKNLEAIRSECEPETCIEMVVLSMDDQRPECMGYMSDIIGAA